jgi:phenylacetate-CoA ligase
LRPAERREHNREVVLEPAVTGWDRFRDDVKAMARAGAADQIERLTWNWDRVYQAQRDGLHRLLQHAAEHSPFHRRRLAGIDLSSVDPADMSALPVMTKAQMMDALDDVFTDRRLARRDVEAAVTATRARPVPILDDYVALASGGCAGPRGLFVFDKAAINSYFAAIGRPALAPGGPAPVIAPDGIRVAMVAAPSAVHATGFGAALTADGGFRACFDLVPATLPVDQIVQRLNTLQPPVLGGYASMLARLALEARAGRLQIAPLQISSTSETLLPEMRSVIRQAFGAPVADSFACTEGLIGKAAPDDDVLKFNTDMCVVELVDAANRPVPPGVPSTKVLVTNLYNLIQPLIRYELNDVFVAALEDYPYLRARVRGRSDDVLRYETGGETADVHPVVISEVMVRSPDVVDYQIHQVPRGIVAYVVAGDRLDVDGLVAQLRNGLAAAGIQGPTVTVERADRLERHPLSGKLRRFVPLPGN